MKILKHAVFILECGLYGVMGTILIMYLMATVKGVIQKQEESSISLSVPASIVSFVGIGAIAGILIKSKENEN